MKNPSKAERIIQIALLNPTKRNVRRLANLTADLLSAKSRARRQKTKLLRERDAAEKRINNHNWDVATGRKTGSEI